MSYKLIIFDLDGTLVNTSRDLSDALNYALKKAGIPVYPENEIISMVGEGISKLIDKAVGEKYIGKKESVLGDFLDYYGNHIADYSRPYPNVVETLDRLNEYKKAVISNKRESLSVSLLEKLDLLKYFDLVVGSDTAMERKPSAVPVYHALRVLDAMPSDSIMMGDSPIDIEAGKKAGIKTVAVTYGFRHRSLLRDADYLIDNFEDIITIVTGRYEIMERRREKRHYVPEDSRDNIFMTIRVADESVRVKLLDFSDHGVKIESPIPFDVGSLRECNVTIPMSLTKGVSFNIAIRHCIEADNGFVMGAEIQDIGDMVWFRIIKKVHDFISEKDYFQKDSRL